MEKLIEFRTTKDATTRANIMNSVLVPLGEIIRDELCGGYGSDLEIGIMVFDRTKREMVCIGAVRLEGGGREWKDYDVLVFDYGEGLAGRAFKVKENRVYFETSELKDVPDYYVSVEGGPHYRVLVSLPIRVPKQQHNVYAVLNCGSADLTHPLARLGAADGTVPQESLGAAYELVNNICYNDLAEAVGIPADEAHLDATGSRV